MTVDISVHVGLAWLRFGTGERANALTTQTRRELRQQLEQLAEDPRVRAVVLQGQGGHFSAGQDLDRHQERLAGGAEAIGVMVREEFTPIVLAITQMPKPVVACLEGAATGAGLGLALACDLRIASADARLGTAFTKVGLGPDSGVSWFLPRLVGQSRAVELLLRPRLVPAPEAEQLGMVHEVVPGESVAARAREVGRELAEGPTVAYAATKATLAAASGTLAETLEAESVWQTTAAGTHDHRAAVQAFIDKQQPIFQGR